jgi:ribosomal peptide maturation radical SAM protein 1
MPDVLLLCMPFGPVFYPSIGLSLLRAGLARHNVSTRVRYFSIDFAERIGQAFYCNVAFDWKGPPAEYLVGEWIFAAALNDVPPAGDDSYVEDILLNRFGAFGDNAACSPAFVRRVLDARRRVPEFLDACLEEVLRDEPKIVGFTSVFHQHVASLALARAIKRARRHIRVVFGGANCEGEMGAETQRQFPFIDAVVSGEGDLVFPEIVRRALGSEPLTGLQGVYTPDTVDDVFGARRFSSAPMVPNLDDLPYADHNDFFEQFKKSRYDRDWQPSVPFETSRGCWWGERTHCTFCGLNGASLHFRSKSAARALDELTALVNRYPDADVEVVDNILDTNYFSGFLPAVAGRRLNASLLWETKSNLKKDQVRILRDAGVRILQPGIESLSDRVLQLMRKGVTALQNIQLLKWCKEFGVNPRWNFIWGFPHEPPEEYARMTALVPLLTHLPPPMVAIPIGLDRFSPLFAEGEKAGITAVAPLPSYRHVYRLPPETIANMAYYFTFSYLQPQDVEAYTAPLSGQIDAWQKVSKRSDLFAVDVDGHLVIWDLRPAFHVPITVLSGVDRALYQACDGICDLYHGAEIAAHSGCGPAEQSSNVEDTRARLDSFVARGLAVRQENRYLALAVPLGDYSPPPHVVEEVYRLARVLGDNHSGTWIVPLDGIDDRARRVDMLRRVPRNGSKRSRQRRGALTPASFSITDQGELAIR